MIAFGKRKLESIKKLFGKMTLGKGKHIKVKRDIEMHKDERKKKRERKV